MTDVQAVDVIGLACVAVSAGSAYGYYWWTVGRFFQSTAISPYISGFIAAILVGDNQRVKAGQLVVRLDDRDVRAAADHAEAILKAGSATPESLRAKYELQQSTIQQAGASLEAKIAQADFATIGAERYHALLLSDSGSRQDEQRTAALDKQGRAVVTSAQAGLVAAKLQLDVLSAEIAEADAAVAQAQADLQTARLNLGYAEIRSPIDGYVGNRAAQVGAYVSQGAYL
jgi:membrane fusion protein (multidrug efflux system)